jgi:large subunit ribosomal protein L18
MKTTASKKVIHAKRVARIRAIIFGTAIRPRLSVCRSNTSLTVQLVDDAGNKTIGSFVGKGKNMKSAAELGITVADYAKKHKIKKFVFDRGGCRYHGVVKKLADSVREGGIVI